MLKVEGRWAAQIEKLMPKKGAVREEHDCEHCGAVFLRRGCNHRYCSRSCRQLAWIKSQPVVPEPPKPRPCLMCEAMIDPTGVVGAPAKTCSAECRRLWTNERARLKRINAV